MKKFIVLLFVVSFVNQAFTQESEENEDQKKHVVTMSIAHSRVGKGVVNGKRKAIVLPAWGVNYDRIINEKWSLGLHTDIIIEEFEFEKDEDEDISASVVAKRSRPFSSAITLSHRLNKFLGASIGFGREISKEEGFNLIRIGIEPYFELPKDFEVVATFSADFRFEAYNAFNFALGIAKKF